MISIPAFVSRVVLTLCQSTAYRSTYDMRDPHTVIVDDIRQMVCRQAIRFDEHRVLGTDLSRPATFRRSSVLYNAISEVGEGWYFARHSQSDYVILALSRSTVGDFLRNAGASAVIVRW